MNVDRLNLLTVRSLKHDRSNCMLHSSNRIPPSDFSPDTSSRLHTNLKQTFSVWFDMFLAIDRGPHLARFMQAWKSPSAQLLPSSADNESDESDQQLRHVCRMESAADSNCCQIPRLTQSYLCLVLHLYNHTIIIRSASLRHHFTLLCPAFRLFSVAETLSTPSS